MDNVEYIANQFACELLMPEEKFREAVKKDGAVTVISNLFNVPVKAVKFRAEQLGYKIINKKE